MIVSEARRAANRRNALHSTGPRTAEGKEQSRANALKHGLCAAVVVAEDPEAVRRRADDWSRALKPQNSFHSWLVDDLAVLSLRIDRSEQIERQLRNRHSLRAEVSWDDDRRLDAETLGKTIGRSPGKVVESLRRTPQGCEWLMTRWAMLAHSADVKGIWTDDQARLAFDLLGTPPEFREGQKPGVALDFDGLVVEPADDPAAVARREIAALKERREVVAGLDDVDRSLAEADLFDESNPELKRLRRYEASLHRRLRWCLAQLQDPTAPHGSHSEPAPRGAIEPESPTPARPVPETPRAGRLMAPPDPPLDLGFGEDHGPGLEFDFQAMIASNLEKIRIESEALRELDLPKLERLRT